MCNFLPGRTCRQLQAGRKQTSPSGQGSRPARGSCSLTWLIRKAEIQPPLLAAGWGPAHGGPLRGNRGHPQAGFQPPPSLLTSVHLS